MADKNPKRVAAGKKAYRAMRRKIRGTSKGRSMSKPKRTSHHYSARIRAGYRRASSTLGKLVKAIVILAPATMVAVQAYYWFGKGHEGIKHAFIDFASCFSGFTIDAGGLAVWIPERLLVGWGPAIVIGGVQYGMKMIHAQGNNPFRVLSTLG